MSLLRRHRRYRRSRRSRRPGRATTRCGCCSARRAESGRVDAVSGQREGVKVNDLFLAAGRRVQPLRPAQHRANREPGRRLRSGPAAARRPQPLRHVRTVPWLHRSRLPPRRAARVPQLLRCVARQTSVLRSRGVGQENLIWMLANAAKRFVPARETLPLLPQGTPPPRRHLQRQPEQHLGRPVPPPPRCWSTSASPPARWSRWSSTSPPRRPPPPEHDRPRSPARRRRRRRR